VIRARRPRFGQAKRHRYNHEAPAPFALEEAVAITEPTGIAIEFHGLARREIDCPQALEALAHLEPIRTDILDWRGADRARNQRKVFKSRQTLRQGPRHEVVPLLAGAGFDEGGVSVLADHFTTTQ